MPTSFTPPVPPVPKPRHSLHRDEDGTWYIYLDEKWKDGQFSNFCSLYISYDPDVQDPDKFKYWARYTDEHQRRVIVDGPLGDYWLIRELGHPIWQQFLEMYTLLIKIISLVNLESIDE